MKKLIEFKEENIVDKTDFDIICCMFELHKELPPVAKVLYDYGFTLPENEIVPGYSHNSLWKWQHQNKPPKILKYSDKYHETMSHRADRYHKEAEYSVEDLVAKYEYRMGMLDFGRIKRNHKLCTITKKTKVILEHKTDYET